MLPSGGFKPPASAYSAIRARTRSGYARSGWLGAPRLWRIRDFDSELEHGAPQQGTHLVGQGWFEPVNHEDAFDHGVEEGLLLGVFLVTSTMVVLFNLITDLVYRLVDPRIELGA